MNENEFGERYYRVIDRLAETEVLLDNVMKLITLINIDREMFTGWLDVGLADMLDEKLAEYDVLVEKYRGEEE